MNYSACDVLQPFFMEILPIKQLVLFNFDKNPDKIYSSLELQRLDSPTCGIGFRLIAYRVDGYIDVYDEPSITLLEKDKEGFNVCGKGLNKYTVTPFSDVYVTLESGNLKVHFSLCDYTGRRIEALIEEHAKRPSRAFDLIAPIGVSSENPVSLPVFAMYQFDVVRKKNTIASLTIDGKPMILDSFPVPLPKDGQMRYFMRYGYDCELVDFGPSDHTTLTVYQCTNGKITDNNLLAEYVTDSGKYLMKTLGFCHSDHFFKLYFENGFPDLLRMTDGTIIDRFKMQMEDSMGYFAGEYTVSKHGQSIDITLEPSNGWVVKNKTFFTKMMLQKNSVFRAWPTTYCYTQHIDLSNLNSTTSWKRLKKNIKTTI